MSSADRPILTSWPHRTLFAKGAIMTQDSQGKTATVTQMKAVRFDKYGGIEVLLDGIRAAFEQLEQGHTRGKIVLLP